jgi:hypothetical protein
MPITDKQRKMIWTGAILFCLYYFVPALVSAGRHAFTAEQPAITKPSPAHVAVSPPMDAATQQAVASAAQFDKLAGDWTNSVMLPNRGLCKLALQLRTVPGKPGSYNGYSTTSCMLSLALLGHSATRENMAKDSINSMTPTSTIMTGTVTGGQIVFHIDQAIGTPPEGCTPMESFRASPFADQVAVEWRAGACSGQMVLNRVTNLR